MPTFFESIKANPFTHAYSSTLLSSVSAYWTAVIFLEHRSSTASDAVASAITRASKGAAPVVRHKNLLLVTFEKVHRPSHPREIVAGNNLFTNMGSNRVAV